MRREIASKQLDSHYLILRSAVFDPLESEPKPLKIGQAQLESTRRITADSANQAQLESQRSEYFIVQFNEPIQSMWTDKLHAQGFEIAGYLANNAFIVKAQQSNVARLQSSESNVRWIGAYGAGLKVDSDLSELANEVSSSASLQSEAQQVYQISILTFKGESAASIREALSQINLFSEPIIEARSDGRVWGVFAVRGNELAKLITTLAAVPGVEWIEERKPNRLQNDNVVRAVQSGFISYDTPLYRNGLTGAGQIYGTADSGLDSDHSQFRLDSNAASQTLSYPTTTASLVNGLLPVKITNQNNKVLAYYLLGSSGFIESKDNPHTGQTLDPARQSGTAFLNAVAYDDNSKQYHGTLTTSTAVGRNYAANGSGAVPGISTRSTGDGVAPDARIVFQDVGHPSGQLPGVDFVSQAMIHAQAYSSGVRVHNNSYGPAAPVSYDQNAADIDDAMWRLRDYTIFFAAGNNSLGDYQVINVAKNNIVVGATDSLTGKGSIENLAPNSNHGPTFDGRIKPDIVAPGTVIGATEDTDDQNSSSYNNATSATAKDAAVNPDDPNNNSTLTEKAVSGTSFASAAVAGGALLVRQYFTDGYYPSGAKNTSNAFTPSNALIKALILNSGRNVTGRFTASNYPVSVSGALPNSGQGWGRIALDDALYFAGDRRELKVLADIYNGATASESNRPAPNAAITTGQTHTYQIANVSNVEPLKITLAWSDPRAAVGSAVSLVNNLNLEIVDPNGAIYRGNVNFSNAWSQVANGASFDSTNPVEAVYIQNPVPGTYTVRVIGENVPGNGQTQITAQPGDQKIDSNRQGYALIATGNFSAGAQPVLSLASSDVSGGVNGDAFISRNETVTATVTVNNPSQLTAQNVSIQVSVDESSQVPASSIRLNGLAAGQSASLSIGDVAPGANKQQAFQVTLVDDGVHRVGQSIILKITMTPAGGLSFTTRLTIIAQMKLVTYRTRFEPAPDAGGPSVIVIPESAWRKRKDNTNAAPDTDKFSGDWQLTTAQHSDHNNSTASLSDPSGPSAGYGISKTSRSDGLVYDDTRWWSPKIAIPGLNIVDSTGLASNPEDAAKLQAAIDSFEVDVKADFTGDVSQNSNEGDFAVMRIRTYDNTVPIKSTDDSGATTNNFTNLLYLDAKSVTSTGFVHYSGNNFASGTGLFSYVDTLTDTTTDVNKSDAFFR
ncbi:MAG TPA: S8 family serine peptidase, partial [Blastocatellia bacterium]|nr:S8 family serine peptidase [Blastocatellia bacterium]